MLKIGLAEQLCHSACRKVQTMSILLSEANLL